MNKEEKGVRSLRHIRDGEGVRRRHCGAQIKEYQYAAELPHKRNLCIRLCFPVYLPLQSYLIGCIFPCIRVHQISQLSPHVLIQSMRTSFGIHRLINRQNTGYNCRIRVMGARIGLLVIIFPNQTSSHPAIFSLLIPTFRGRNQRFIVECTLLWTITGYRPQCKVSSKVS